MYKTILVPTDGSELSQQAVEAAIAFARAAGGAIVAFSVAEPYPAIPLADGAMVIDPEIDGRALQAIAEARVQRVQDAARAAGVPCETAIALSFRPHEEIVAAAAKHHCGLSIMATHGRRGWDKLLLGSETQKVLAHATVPVLVFPPRA